MKRLYTTLIAEQFAHHRQMLFLSGPRQVGKTTIGKTSKRLCTNYSYLNWDDADDAALILKGQQALADHLKLSAAADKKAIIVFDEIHKFADWRNFLKGFFDKFEETVNIIVTGSAKLDLFRRGGDSLMGRYFSYRVHPLSVAECLRITLPTNIIHNPKKISPKKLTQLFEFGGFPEPFQKANKRFYMQWQQLRLRQLLREDVRDLTHVHDLPKLEMLSLLLKHYAGQLLNYSNLASKVRVSSETIQSWVELLNSFYYCFTIKPWTKNITRSLLKQPKLYLWDWAQINDPGCRFENFIASQLLKAVHFWTDHGLGKFDLYFIRDKEKREIDFVVTRDDTVWFLVEAKLSEKRAYTFCTTSFSKTNECRTCFSSGPQHGLY